MATETTPTSTGRPNPLLLIALAIVVAGYVVYVMFSGSPTSPNVPTTPAGRTQGAANGGPIDPEELDVKVEELKKAGPGVGESGRNIFRFYTPPPPPPAPPPPAAKVAPNPVFTPTTPPGPPVDPGPPPIGNTIKFIGIAETDRGKIGAFSVWDQQTRECKATFPGREGEVIEGRYRVVRIGIESAVLEYLDGQGKATLPLNGQACVSK